jgi:hypothetical protein
MTNHQKYKFLIVSVLVMFAVALGSAQSATVTVNQDKKIEQILALKMELEQANKLSSGYTIQLYYGELNEANAKIKKYRSVYEAWPASIEYETPNYKVWVGNFATRLEADRALLEIKNTFPAAFILKPERRK